MRKKIYFNALFLLAVLWVFGFQMTQAQCDPNNFTVSVTEATCPNNGVIEVLLPGGSPCVGWQAILTNPGGLETVLNVPDSGGPVIFGNLAAGTYMVRLINGPDVIQSPDNPITVTSSYQVMSITSNSTAPTCPGATDASLTVDINSGGNGPFQYTLTPPGPGVPQTFGPTSNRTHTFTGLNGGETVSLEVTDLDCSISQVQNPVLADNTTAPSSYLHSTFQRKCSPDCNTYDAKFFTTVPSLNGITAIQQPGNATISINGGVPENLTLDIVNGNIVSFIYPPGLDENVLYDLNFNDGCGTFGVSNTTLAVDDTLLTVHREIAIASDCTLMHLVGASSITSNGSDNYNMYCRTNNITIEQETPVGSDVWVNVPLVGGTGNPLNAQSPSSLYTLPGEGTYRITGIDDCHTATEEFNTLVPTNPLDNVRVLSSFSVLEGTGALMIDRIPGNHSSHIIPETTYSISPIPFQSSATINPTQPFNLGGTYTINFPVAYTTTINRTFIGDLPPGDYEITSTDICGNLSVQSYTITDTAQYSPDIQGYSGCANSGSITYDMNTIFVANSTGPQRVNTVVELWTDDGSGSPGTLITDDIPDNGLKGVFSNLAAGDYVIRFSNINFQTSDPNAVFSAVTLDNSDREYWTTVSIASFQNITASAAAAFCDFTDPNTGIVFAEITSGTPTYPIDYELFEISDLANPIRTHQETDTSVTNHLFNNVAAGDYVVRITTPCDGLDLNINLIPAPITTLITADMNPLCTPGGDVELSINLPTSIFDITWTDNLGSVVGMGNPVTVTSNTTTTYTASYVIKPAFCPAAPINTNDITITVNPDVVQVGTETSSCNPLGTEYTLVAEVTGTGPFTAAGTGAPGIFTGNIWTSDPIPAGTDYTTDFTDANACNTLTLTGTAPNCCVLDLNLAVSDIDLCLNTGPYSTTIANSVNGFIYEIQDPTGTSFIPALTGVGNGGDLSITIPPAHVPSGGTDYQIVVTNGIAGCNGILVDPLSFINGNPDTSLNVTGDSICTGDAAMVTLSNSQIGVSYQLLQSGVPLSPAVTGTGTGGDLQLIIPASHPQLTSGIYAIEATAAGCSRAILSQSAPISVNPLLEQIGSETTSCALDGQSYTLTVVLNGTGPFNGVGTGTPGTFSGNTWTSDPIPAGTDYTIDFTDTHSCNVVTVADLAPLCCIFEVTCPTFTTTTVSCYEDIPMTTVLTEAEFEALGNGDGIIGDSPCGVIEITAANTPHTGNCHMNVARTYTVTEYADTNNNGIRDLGENIALNTATCTQNIIVQDTMAPLFVETLPSDFTMGCTDEFPLAETLTATDNCGTATVDFSETIVDNGCIGNYAVLRTWVAYDPCGNQTTHTQTISVVDNIAPSFVETLPQDGFVDCDTIPEAALLTATDNCGLVTVDFTETQVPGNCSSQYNIVRSWTATDDCGNTTSHTQTLAFNCPIKIYNAVSANDNGENDIFLLEGIDCFPNNQVEIFNRWGVKVFEANGYDNENQVFKGYSDGRLTVARNEKLPTGTYFYIVRYEILEGNEPKTVQQSGYLYLSSNN